MTLIDSNIIIYSARPEFSFLWPYLRGSGKFVSAITRLEVLGFRGLSEEDRALFHDLFGKLAAIAIDDAVIEQAITLRQHRRMGLADSLVAATALSRGLTLVTRNVADFRWIDGLALTNPFEAAG